MALSQLRRLQSRYDQPLRGYLPITFRLGQCSYLLWAPFRGATAGDQLSTRGGLILGENARAPYLAGQEGFEPSTIRLTAERTTAVLLTQKRQSPDVSARALFILHAAT